MFNCKEYQEVDVARDTKTEEHAEALVMEADGVDGPMRAFTAKAFLIGGFFSFFLAIGAPYANMVIRGSWMALDFSTPGALFLFFFLTGVLNVVLRATKKPLPALIFLAAVTVPYTIRIVRGMGDPNFSMLSPGMIFSSFILVLSLGNFLSTLWRRSAALNRRELLVVYVMMIVASAIPEMGLAEELLPIIAGAFYYATPENQWAELFHPYIKDWLVVRDSEAIQQFFEGAPKGQPLPWGAWREPLMYWLPFLIVLSFVMICLMVMVRRQWMERERLIYPLVQTPLEMVQEDPKGGIVNPFFKNPLMWAGFALPVIVSTINGLHNYYSFIPGLQIVSSVPLFRRMVSLIIRLSFPMVGFSYLINLDIAFSLWFFNIVANTQKGILGVLGITNIERLDYGAGATPSLAHQGIGALVVLVVLGLWVGRSHLKDVFRKAFRGDADVDDSDEIMSYRVAVFGALGGMIFMTLWMWQSGLAFWASIVFVLVAFLIFIGLTRVVVESGAAEAVASSISSSVLVSAVGSTVLGPLGMTSVAFTYVWCADIRSFVMASAGNGLKLSDELGRRKRPLFWAMLATVVVALGGAIWMIMRMSYAHGGINLNSWFFRGNILAPFNYITYYLKTPSTVNWWGWIHTVIGGGVMVALIFARQHFLWWPLHPVGYPIGCVWLMDQMWFSIFLAWLIKAVALKYGGPVLYRRLRPFFLGMVLGQFVIAGTWLIIDYFTGMTDNSIFWA